MTHALWLPRIAHDSSCRLRQKFNAQSDAAKVSRDTLYPVLRAHDVPQARVAAAEMHRNMAICERDVRALSCCEYSIAIVSGFDTMSRDMSRAAGCDQAHGGRSSRNRQSCDGTRSVRMRIACHVHPLSRVMRLQVAARCSSPRRNQPQED